MLTSEEVQSFKQEGHRPAGLCRRGYRCPVARAVLGPFGVHDRRSRPVARASRWLSTGSALWQPARTPVHSQRSSAAPLAAADAASSGVARPERERWSMPGGHLDGYPGEGCQAVLMDWSDVLRRGYARRGYVYWPGQPSNRPPLLSPISGPD